MRRAHRLPLLLAFLSAVVWGGALSEFRICAYNVQNFNSKKAANFKVVHTLTRIISRCDIILLQEVTDSDGSAIKKLLSSLNRYSGRYESYHYSSVSSSRMGKSPDDMQKYVFIYRTETVKVTDQYQYPDQKHFVRAPLAVHFHSDTTGIQDFVLVGLHADKDNAVKEMDHLYDVFEKVLTKWNNENVMFLGDFHAGCAHMTQLDKKNIRLFTNTSFSWLIGDKTDTTVTDKTSCAYDRIVVYGRSFLKAITPFSAAVFNYAQQFKLTRTGVLMVSDHFPVEVRLKGSAPLIQATPLLLLIITALHSFL
ncbi:deoxyribonuclease gamma-like isoform X1 [Nerophis ophidion]|uniref:deoxyribonuclease gamma-like isoform X1 n=1 Tax=Nerophis ophidion TaxID=159077 RepID=UPI002ADFAB79|nr:deoxyribonuclease gamma-like isoform X1 [Nerophis ophidion]